MWWRGPKPRAETNLRRTTAACHKLSEINNILSGILCFSNGFGERGVPFFCFARISRWLEIDGFSGFEYTVIRPMLVGQFAIRKEVFDLQTKFSELRLPEGFPVAMAYVKWQELCEMYPPDTALEAGTLFPELDKPFEGWTIMNGGGK